MKILIKSASYLFHPLWMPLSGSLLYFLISPRFFPLQIMQAKLLAIGILTVFIPVTIYGLLRTIGSASSIMLDHPRERKWPLLYAAFLYLLILQFVLDIFDYRELYYYFSAILLSTLLTLSLVFFNVKVSLHMLGLTGLLSFIILLSIHFNQNLIATISFLISITGLTATSRLYMEAHNTRELMLGILLGAIPQALLAFKWL